MKEEILNGLKAAMVNYNSENAKIFAIKSVEEKINPLETVRILTESIAEIGDRFEKGELFLPDLMMAAKTMQSAISPLEDDIKSKGLKRETVGKVVIGTVFGDLHDIGKGMVATMLNANGFEVVDLGVNVDSTNFLKAIKEHKPDLLALSSLLTTTAPEQERIIKALKDAGIRDKVKIMVGGGPITEDFAERIGADGYEPTAPLAVKLAKRLINE